MLSQSEHEACVSMVQKKKRPSNVWELELISLRNEHANQQLVFLLQDARKQVNVRAQVIIESASKQDESGIIVENFPSKKLENHKKGLENYANYSERHEYIPVQFT